MIGHFIQDFARSQFTSVSSPWQESDGRGCWHVLHDWSDGWSVPSRRSCRRVALCGLGPGESQLRAVQPGRIYRSGQMPASALARTIRDYRIKTVLNLRGANKDRWYRAERATTLEAGATQVDIPMSSCIWMSRAQLRTLDRDVRYGGISRCSSIASGVRSAPAWPRPSPSCSAPDGTLEDARAQFSIGYLFVRVNDGKVMAEHLDQYERWLAGQRI